MEFTFEFLQELVQEALTEGLIQRYFARYSEIKNLFTSKCGRNITHSEFIPALMNHGIAAPTNNGLYFFPRHITTLEKQIRPKICNICKSTIDQKNHSSSLQHSINEKYLKNMQKFTPNNVLQMKIEHTEFVSTHTSDLPRLKILSLVFKNTGNSNQNVKDVVLIQQTGLSITCDKDVILKPNETMNAEIKGTLESDSVTIYIAIVIKKGNELTLYQDDIPIDVVRGTDHILGGIIRGVLPEDTVSVKRALILRQYRIGKSFMSQLHDVSHDFPDFVRRKNYPDPSIYNQWAKILKVPTKLTQQNYCRLLTNILDIEEYQMIFDIRYYDTTETLKFEKTIKVRNQPLNLYSLKVPGLAEAKPSLLRNDSVFAQLEKRYNSRHKYEGIVHQVREAEVILGFHKSFNAVKVRSADNQRFIIQFGFNRRPLRVEKQALDLLKLHQIKHFLFPTQVSRGIMDDSVITNFFNRDLNDEQRRAVQHISTKPSVPYVIFGPPGTGKTITIVEAVLQIWKRQNDANILICTPSNDAADVITDRLFQVIQDQTAICRFVGYRQSYKKVKYYQSDINATYKKRIVISTIINAANFVNCGIKPGHFSYVFIDESGYATESESIIPIAGILSSEKNKGKLFGQVVLAGDPRQLGPRIHSSFAKFCGYGTSMLERLIDTCGIYKRRNDPIHYDPNCVTKLLVNYRSHEAILKIPNDLFYDGDLRAKNSDLSQLFTSWDELPSQGFPVIFHNVTGDDIKESRSPSFFNDKELKIVMDYVTKLMQGTKVRGKTITENDVSVITPYRLQAEKIKAACQKSNWNKLRVGSVQQFQGKESTVVIISTVRSNNFDKYKQEDQLFDLGLINNWKRFNVALTRAKALLVVVGNGKILSNDSHWRSFIDYCINNRSLRGPKFELANDIIYGFRDNSHLDDDGPSFARGNV